MTYPVLFKATIVVSCPYEGKNFDETFDLLVKRLAPDRLLLQESSSWFDEYKLFFGDEIIVEPMSATTFRLVSEVTPSTMCHYGNLAGTQPPEAFTERLRTVGGAWEYDFGGYYTIHVPRAHRDELTRAFGVPSPNEDEIKGGLRPWEESDE